jgi:hypothetical protein
MAIAFFRDLFRGLVLPLVLLAGTIVPAAAVPLPSITSFSPNYSHLAGGDTITVTGTGFVSGQTTLQVGSHFIAAGQITVNSATSMTFTSPASSRGSSGVDVTTPAGTSTHGGVLLYPDVPLADSMTPTVGPIAGGTSVTITGLDYLDGETTITIGGTVIPAGSVTVQIWPSSTTATFTTPAHAAGNVAVTVTTPIGTSTAVPGGFTYAGTPAATSLSPTSGPTIGGTEVTITGSGFIDGDTTVTIGSTTIPAGSVTVNSDTSLTFTTPADVAGNVPVSVTTTGGASSPVSGGYTYDDGPSDSERADQVQSELSVFVSRASERAITSAVGDGIALGLSGGGMLDVSPAGAFMAYVPDAPAKAFSGILNDGTAAAPASNWSMWLDVRGTGLLGDGDGRQVNLTGGIGYRITPDLVVGAVAGRETFDYRSEALGGRLTGDGTSVGGYAGWRSDAITLDAMLVYSALRYNVEARTAFGSLDASRWLGSAGATSEFALGDSLMLRPSARLSAVWESQGAWTDNLDVGHDARTWLSGTASFGATISSDLHFADDLIATLRVGGFAGYRYEQDGYEGIDGRLDAGVSLASGGGAALTLDGELAWLATSAPSWSLRAGVGAGF